MDLVHRLLMIMFQVVAVAGFTPVEEVDRILMEPREKVEKVVRDSFREGWVEDHDIYIHLSMVGLVEVMNGISMEEEEEGTQGEAVEDMCTIPVGVVVDPSMLEKISRMNVATTQLVMVR